MAELEPQTMPDVELHPRGLVVCDKVDAAHHRFYSVHDGVCVNPRRVWLEVVPEPEPRFYVEEWGEDVAVHDRSTGDFHGKISIAVFYGSHPDQKAAAEREAARLNEEHGGDPPEATDITEEPAPSARDRMLDVLNGLGGIGDVVDDEQAVDALIASGFGECDHEPWDASGYEDLIRRLRNGPRDRYDPGAAALQAADVLAWLTSPGRRLFVEKENTDD